MHITLVKQKTSELSMVRQIRWYIVLIDLKLNSLITGPINFYPYVHNITNNQFFFSIFVTKFWKITLMGAPETIGIFEFTMVLMT